MVFNNNSGKTNRKQETVFKLYGETGHKVFDEMRRMFYGPGGAYSMFTGKEASRALALLSFKPQDINGNLEDLGPEELQVLEDWEDKFMEKYAKVGQLVPEPTPADQAGCGDETHEIEN